MPNFVIECSENVFRMATPKQIMQTVTEVSMASGLFARDDIKVRINPFFHFELDEGQTSFLHVFGYIMEGRSVDQKNNLSREIVKALNQLLPDLSILSMNIADFQRAGYCNKSTL